MHNRLVAASRGRTILYPTDAFRCHPGRLENLLGKDLSISWDKRLNDLQLASQSKELTASFNDGYSLKTRCLIGCDGSHSVTRQTLISAMKLQVLPYVVFNGKRLISITEYMTTINDYMQNHVLAQAHKGETLLEISFFFFFFFFFFYFFIGI